MNELGHWLAGLTVCAAVGAGTIGGAFFAFSSFVMRALEQLPPREGAAAMRRINVVVINPMFLGAFLGTAVACAALVVTGIVRWDEPAGWWLMAGGATYLLGTFAVTMFSNVPLNEALAKVTADDPELPRKWNDYVRRWSRWNHVRTIAALASAASLMVALRR